MRTITFYSYKGGTGRTLLVANMGVLAARLGMRVVMVDLDLEAPGLPYKFFPEPPDRAGVLQWLVSSPRPTVDQLAQPLPVPDPFLLDGSLTLIAAGPNPSLAYLQVMQHVQQGPLAGHAEPAIGALLELRDAIRQQLNPDLLLLDARTGITTTNAITTRVLADDIVALTLNTPEQLGGTRAVLRSLVPLTKPSDQTPLGLYVVISRIRGRPNDVGTYEITDDEYAIIRRVNDFLTEPALPLATTLSRAQLKLLHNDTEVAEREQLLLARTAALESRALHLDYVRVAYGLLGDRLDTLVDEAMRASTGVERRRDIAIFFGRTDVVLDTKPPTAEVPDLLQAADRFGDDAPAAERVRILRALGDVRRAPELAAALTDLADAQHNVGELTAAIDSLKEAADLYHNLNLAGVEGYLAEHVSALNALSNFSSEAGRPTEALDSAKKAADIAIDALRPDPTLKPLFATTLAILASRYGETGSYGEGIQPLEDAIKVFRELNDHPPAGRYRAQLASALSVLGVLNSNVGFTNEARAAATESVAIWRSLVAADPDQYELRLARALNNLGNHRRLTGEFDEATAATEEALTIYRKAAYTDPDRYLDGLATTLVNLAAIYGDAGRRSEALTAAEESLHIRRDLAEADPQRFGFVIASALNSVAAQYGARGEYAQAADRAQEAILRLRDLGDDSRRNQQLLAATLNNYALSSLHLGRIDEALQAARDALDVYRAMRQLHVDPKSVWYQEDLARTLLNLSAIYSTAQQPQQALAHAVEATDIYRQLAYDNPQRSEENYGNALIALSLRQRAIGDADAAIDSANQAVSTYRRLADDDPDRYRPKAATALEALSDALNTAGELDAADAARTEAQQILKAAVRQEPSP